MILETIKWHQWFQVISEETIVNKNKLILIKGVYRYLLDLFERIIPKYQSYHFLFIYLLLYLHCWMTLTLPYNFNKTHNILTHE